MLAGFFGKGGILVVDGFGQDVVVEIAVGVEDSGDIFFQGVIEVAYRRFDVC